MGQQVILRPVYNRLEMFYLSVEYEIRAREHYQLPDDFVTIFLVEHGAPPEIFELLRNYPFRSHCILRPRKFGLTVNILEGFKEAFSMADDYVIYIEDDVLVHKFYLQYLDIIMNMDGIGKYSVISPYSQNDDGDVHKIYRGHHYAALAPLITREFYIKYIYPDSNANYYNDTFGFIAAMDEKYKEYNKNKKYKYASPPVMHAQQAGKINRDVDRAMIEEDMYVIMPRVNRQQHIGIYGANRQIGKSIPGNTFEERVDNLREIIKDPVKMYDMTGSKCYNDYLAFSDKLNTWDGSLKLV